VSSSPRTVAREAGTSKPAGRRIRRRLSGNHLLIALVVVLAFSLNYLALQDRGDQTMVAVADRPLVAGSVISASDLRFMSIDSDFGAIDSMITQSAAAAYDGWILQAAVAEGDLINPSALIEPGAPDGLRSMSIPIAVEHAAGGTLVAGDRIDVVSVVDGVAQFVAAGIELLGVSEDEGGSLGGLSSYHLVVAVDSDQALALAQAIESGSIEIIRSTGASDLAGEIGRNDS
jgi:Flp pilus assembly protein CpaB